jgi:hypothetical protein
METQGAQFIQEEIEERFGAIFHGEAAVVSRSHAWRATCPVAMLKPCDGHHLQMADIQMEASSPGECCFY